MKKPIIICVDDEKIVLDSLKEQLKREFKETVDIEVISSAEKAMDVFNELLKENAEIPIIISDQVMPGMRGDELLIKLHILAPKTLKILLTGQASAEAVGKVVNQANLYRFIGKPWEKDDLYLTVKEALHSYFQDKNLEEKNILLQNKNEELVRTINIFNKFVPNQFLKILNIDKNKDHIELGQCAARTVSIMFSDIRSFTSFSESASSDETFLFINEHLQYMSPIILKHQGFIDKFIGDGIMAIFMNADDAVLAGIEMLSAVERHNAAINNQSPFAAYKVGIGINTGVVMMGTVGEADRLETTVIGDAVNLASRVENLTKVYNTPLLISENTCKELKDNSEYSLRSIDQVYVKGRKSIINILEVLDAFPTEIKLQKISIVKIFENAKAHFEKQEYLEAKKLFEECIEKVPFDGPTQFYLDHINNL